MNSNVEVWLWLLLVLLPHNPRTSEILETYGSALEAAKAMRDGSCQLSAAEKQRVERTRTREVKSLICECERLGIRIITLDDGEYPEQLRKIPDPPIVLFVKGTLQPLQNMPAVAVVGPRSPSEYGRKVCEKLCTEMAKDKIALVSGMAVGIDSCVHRSAINNNGYTAAVLGCGIMVNYPAENEGLKNAVLNSGGALISELLPYASVAANYFRHRNRIISGLCGATLVVEAGSHSGALLTAEHALRQDRRLLCVPPHDIFADSFYGAAKLLREGAAPVCSITDIYIALIDSDSRTVRLQKLLSQKEKQWQDALIVYKPVLVKSTPAPKPADPPKPKPAAAEKNPAAEQPEKAEEQEYNTSLLSPEEAEIVELIRKDIRDTDAMIQATGKRYDQICSILLGLELNDTIARNRDGTYSIL